MMASYDGSCCFRGSSKRSLPRVLWELNTTCNLSCSWCHANPHVERGISTAEVKAGLNLLHAWGIQGVIFSGGEPFLRKDMLDLATFAAELGMDVDICTNGTLITSTIATALSRVISEISVSIDSALPSIHDRLRGTPGAWARAVTGIRHLKGAGIEVHSISLLSQETLAGAEATIAFSESLSIDSMTFLGLIRFGNTEYLPLNPDELKKFEADLKLWREHYQRIVINTKRVIQGDHGHYCGAGDSIWGIDAAGNLLPCILAKGKTPSYPMAELKHISSWSEVSRLMSMNKDQCVFPLTQ